MPESREVELCLEALKTANTIGFFDMMIVSIKAAGAKLPSNVDELRSQAKARNIALWEREIAESNHQSFRDMRRRMIEEL